jgi:hypothetical protein
LLQAADPVKRLAVRVNTSESEQPQARPALSTCEQNRKRILTDLESFLVDRKSLSEIRDETELPHSKSVLINAIPQETAQ